jgi:hypothetical protein
MVTTDQIAGNLSNAINLDESGRVLVRRFSS